MATSGSLNTSSFNIDGASDHKRYLTLSWSRSSYSIDNNTTTLDWVLKGAGGSTTYWYMSGPFTVVINGTTVYSSSTRIKLYSGTTVASGSITIAHNSDGAKSFTASVSAAIYYGAVNVSGSQSFILDTIPRASSLSAADGTLGTAQTLTISRASASFTHSLSYSCGSLKNQTAGLSASSGIATSCTFTPPLSLAAQNTSGDSVTVTFTLSTYNGSTLIGSKPRAVTYTIPSSVKPSCSFALSDPTGYADTYGAYVQGYSKVKADITASGAQGSTISSYTTVVAATGGTYRGNPATSDAVSLTGARNVTVWVTDSRGRPSERVVKSITVLPYAAPTLSIAAVRCASNGTHDQEGAYMRISASCTISDLNGANSVSYSVRYKKQSDIDWTTLTGSGASFTSPVIACDVDSIWTVEVTATDAISSTVKATNVPIAFVLMDFHSSGKGIAFGKVATQEGLDCAMNAYFSGSAKAKVFYAQGDANGGLHIPSTLDSKRYWWLFNYIVNGTDYNKLSIRSTNTNGYYADYYLSGKDDGDSTNTAYNILTAKDLEYGTWTPKFVFGTFTYTTQSGSYFKIGKMVYIQCELRTSAATLSSNGLVVGGIPFTPAKYAFMSGILDTVTGSINYRIALRAEPGNNFIRCLVGTSGKTGLSTITTQYPTGAASVQFSGWYQIS